MYEKAKLNRRIRRHGSESINGVTKRAIVPKEVIITFPPKRKPQKPKKAIKRLDYLNLKNYSISELSKHLIPICFTLSKFIDEDKDKAQWWFKTKIKPVLEMIEKKEDNEK